MEEFEALLNESFEMDTPEEGSVVKGRVIAIEAGQAIIDVGYKMEGRVDLKEFANPGETPNISVGDEVEVFLRSAENSKGEAVISREMARREEAWDRLEKAYADEERVDGAIFGRVKGGFTVDLGGAVAFLPGSQVDVRPVRDAGPLMGLKQPFQILKMDRRRGNIVVSRRAILEESRAEQRAEVIGNLTEGQTVDGVVKNITEYGAFVDLGGVDGLLHVTDMAWRRVNHPSEILTIGETVKVQVIKINKETHRISLGMKQLQEDPWDLVAAKYPLESVHTGRVTNITDYGAFVELEPGVEGLVHVSEMSSTPARSFRPLRKSKSWCWKSTVPSGACRSVSSKPCATRGKCLQKRTPRAPRSKAKSRTSPNSVCSSVSKARSTAWSTSRTSAGTSAAKTPSRATRKATWFMPLCPKSTSKKSVSRSRSRLWAATSSPKPLVASSVAR
jgi:ribosomal protein S1